MKSDMAAARESQLGIATVVGSDKSSTVGRGGLV